MLIIFNLYNDYCHSEFRIFPTMCNPHSCLARKRNRGPCPQLYNAQSVQTEFLLLISPVDEYILTICLYLCIYYCIKSLIITNVYLTLWNTVVTICTTYFSIQKPLWFCPTLNSVMLLTLLCRCVMFYVHHEPNLFQSQDSAGWKKYRFDLTDMQLTQCSPEYRLVDTYIPHICLLCGWRQVAVYRTVNSMFTTAVLSAGVRSSTSPRTNGSRSHGDAVSVGVADLSCYL
jgi:hypothetical protein